jgi:single-strand DNA-binding protein
MNVLTIAGNVGRDSELRQVNTASGTQSVLSFAVAVKSSKKGDDGKYLSTWFDCSLWGKRAETLVQYIKKGQSVTVTGEVDLEQYTNGQGQAGAKMKVNVQNVTLQGGSQSAPQQAAQPTQSQAAGYQKTPQGYPAQRQQPPQDYQPMIGQPPQVPDFDQDIPFN